MDYSSVNLCRHISANSHQRSANCSHHKCELTGVNQPVSSSVEAHVCLSAYAHIWPVDRQQPLVSHPKDDLVPERTDLRTGSYNVKITFTRRENCRLHRALSLQTTLNAERLGSPLF